MSETEIGPKLIFSSFGAETVAVAEIRSITTVNSVWVTGMECTGWCYV